MYNPFNPGIGANIRYRDITSSTMHDPNRENSCSNLAWKLVYRVRNILKGDGDGVGEGELIEDCEERVAQVHDRPHEIPWNCIFLSDEDSAADDLNIKDRLLFFTHVDSSTGISTRSGRPRVKQSYRWFLDSGSPSSLPRKTARNESDTGGQRSKRSPSFGSTIFQFFSKSNYLNGPTQWRSPPAGRGYFIKTWNPIQKRGRR